MKPVIFALPGNNELAAGIAATAKADVGELSHRRFPDGESYLRFLTPVEGRSIALACSLHDPDSKSLPLLLAAAALRDLGAHRVGLVTPYLGYMRQDKRFNPGEAVTSVSFARLLSGAFDWIVTIDPHLHRHASLTDIYNIPVGVGHATAVLADYLRPQSGSVFLVGPDEESEQWVSTLSVAASVPFVTMQKTRSGDRSVSIAFSGLDAFRGLRPVLVDDMISSGVTMEVAVNQLLALGFSNPICLAVHGIFADGALARLECAGARVVTTNTIPSPVARLDIYPTVGELLSEFI